ncbi:hypothetical protein ACFYWX_05275 [Streptomyces sp. NPDC002888]|uniref:hypothetical protein n=1 Tax=Streptomyces sp. NPDC002888 TaxID=3364668 RepID=UPI0036B18B90
MNLMSGSRTLSTITVAIASLSISAISAVSANASNAPTAVPAHSAAAPVQWSATHGSATASGTRWTEQSGTATVLVVEGQLRNTGTECSSVWVQWTRDFVSSPYTKQATQCGSEVSPVNVRLNPYRLTTTGRLKVCRGTTDTNDCGTAVSLTTWPISN